MSDAEAMAWADAVSAAEDGGCDACPHPEQCAVTGACINFLEDEIVLPEAEL